MNDVHFIQSSTREKVLEHLFVGDLLRCLWRQGVRDPEILRAEVDKGGYDLVLEANGILRHVQLKSSHRTAKTSQVGINIALERKPSGCVIWIRFNPASGRSYGSAGEPLPALGGRIGKHTKGNNTGAKTERPNIRLLRRSRASALPLLALSSLAVDITICGAAAGEGPEQSSMP